MQQHDKPIRAFLACSPSPQVRREIVSLQETFKKQIPAGVVSWVKPEDIHLTLKFLGNISAAQKETIQPLLMETIAALPVFHLAPTGAGAFPSLSRPKVIWTGLTGETETLLNLQRRIDRALTAAGFSEEDRPFQGHLTLGRVKKTYASQEIAQSLSRARGFAGGQFQVDHISLYKSDLTPDGAIYTLLRTFPLSR
ncbi:MAG: RNA 2',3'-cyclic phosphodiesterase [Syntrophobacterales bacterium]|jgi:2'-5' RNA ligase|nr:RNA 2',3'-cyclic phosphodiesterase [Syntrophobacterales bacterium]